MEIIEVILYGLFLSAAISHVRKPRLPCSWRWPASSSRRLSYAKPLDGGWTMAIGRHFTRVLCTVIPMIVVLNIVSLNAQRQSARGADEAAIRNILLEEVAAWNKGDADGYSQHFASDGTFTNVQGMFFTGKTAFRDRHEEIFKGLFRGTTLGLEIVSLRFVRSDVATVDALTWVSGFSQSGPPPDTHTDAKGRLRTRLLQVLVKDSGEWKITVYHNVDIKPTVSSPEPK